MPSVVRSRVAEVDLRSVNRTAGRRRFKDFSLQFCSRRGWRHQCVLHDAAITARIQENLGHIAACNRSDAG